MEKTMSTIDFLNALALGKMLVVKDGQTITIEPPKYGTITVHFQQGKCVLYEKKETFR